MCIVLVKLVPRPTADNVNRWLPPLVWSLSIYYPRSTTLRMISKPGRHETLRKFASLLLVISVTEGLINLSFFFLLVASFYYGGPISRTGRSKSSCMQAERMQMCAESDLNFEPIPSIWLRGVRLPSLHISFSGERTLVLAARKVGENFFC